MAYTYFNVGDVLPSISTLQILLRRHRPHAQIMCDGQYGLKTKAAVAAFQSHHGLQADGIAGSGTWRKLEEVSQLAALDVVDITDVALAAGEAAAVRSTGREPVTLIGMSNGVDVAMDEIQRRRTIAGEIPLLRFHGHGSGGSQTVSAGFHGAAHLSAISVSNFSQIRPFLMRISGLFCPFGAVQLLGCSVAAADGPSLLQMLANVWGVPVTAATKTQWGGGQTSFRFEGSTISRFPGGGSLSSWSASVVGRYGMVAMPT
jgi:hypothetical protein